MHTFTEVIVLWYPRFYSSFSSTFLPSPFLHVCYVSNPWRHLGLIPEKYSIHMFPLVNMKVKFPWEPMYFLQRISSFSYTEKALKHSSGFIKFCEKWKIIYKIDEVAATTLQSMYRPMEIKKSLAEGRLQAVDRTLLARPQIHHQNASVVTKKIKKI